MQKVAEYINKMPDQHIPSSRKGPKWGRKCVLAIKGMANTVSDNGRSSRENKEANYDIVNSIFKEEDFDYVLNPYGINVKKYGGTPAKMQNYNIVRSRLETLRGEEMNTPLNFFVYAISGEAVSAKKQKRKDVLKDMMKAHIRTELQLDKTITQLEDQMAQVQAVMATLKDRAQLQQMEEQMNQLTQQRNNMPDIQAEMKRFNSEYVDPTEQTNNKLLKYLKRKDKLALKFNQGWFHALVTAEEVYYAGITRSHPSVRAVNPLQFDYDKGANTTFIHEGSWGKEEYWLPVGEVISRWGDVLTDAQVKTISSGQAGNAFSSNGMQQGFVYSYQGGQRSSWNTREGQASHVYILQCAWRSYAKVGMLTYKDPRTNKWITTEVDDTFKITPELESVGGSIEWQWDDEIWEGTMIGSDIFVNVRPKSNQTKNLPYIGYVYNNVNSIATSMVDLVKSHQFTYIIVWWRLEQELAKAKGRKFVMDMAQLPKSHGWDVDQWMYYFENLGVVWINSREEGRKGDPSTVANFNQFQSIDMALSQVVGQYMEVLAKLESLVEGIMGVAPQRMGDIKASETATGAQTAVSRSTNVTKPWFYFHDLVKEAVLDELLELCKIAYMDGTELELVLDEFEIESLKVDGDKLNGSKMGVFVTNSYEDRLKKDKMEELLTIAVRQGKAELIDVANVLDSDSMSYIKSTLEEGRTKAQEAAQASQQAQSEDLAEQRKDVKLEKQLDRAHEAEQTDKGIAKDITLKKMDITKDIMGATQEVEDLVALSGIDIEEKTLALEKEKEATRAAEKQQEFKLKAKEISIKKSKPNATGSKN